MKAKNGDGYVVKTKAGTYSCTIATTYAEPGLNRYKKIKVTRPTREQAIRDCKLKVKAYEKLIKEKNDYRGGLTLTFGEACEDYLEHEVKGEVAQSTYYSYYKSFKQYIYGYKLIRNKQIRNLKKKDFELLYGTWVEKYSPKSISFPLQLCRRVCDWLVERALIEENYAKQCKPKYEIIDDIETVKKLEHKKILTKEDLEKIYNAYKANLKSDYICVVLFLCETGLRPQEFACLENKDIDKEKKLVHVNKSSGRKFSDEENKSSEVYVKVTKTKEARDVFLSPLAMEMIEQMQLKTKMYCKNNYKDLLYPIFSNGNIRSNATMEVGFKKLCDMLDIDRDVHATRGGQKQGLNLYCCRHTCETMMHVKGVPPIMVGAMLGHSPKTGLEYYTHISVEDVRKQAKTPFMIMDEDESNDVVNDDENIGLDKLNLTKKQKLALLKLLQEELNEE